MTWTEIPRKITSRLSRYPEIRASWYVLLPIAYCACLGAYYAAFGKLLQFLPLVFFLVTIPVVALFSPSRGVLKYWTPLVMILLAYEALAGAIGSLASASNVFSLYGLDKLIWGFNLTGWVQTTFSSTSVTMLTTFLYELHMPLVALTAATVWFVRRDYFGKYVTAMTLTSYSALATFILIPTAPPWYVGAAANLVQSYGASAGSSLVAWLSATIESDQFAAFPSLHCAYAIIFTYFMFKLDRRLGLVAVPIACGVLFSTLYLGQHYALDLVGGAVYALVPCLISERFQIFSVRRSSP